MTSNSLDSLTGLPNRSHFAEALVEQVARAHGEGGALTVALLDIDNFKKLNDEAGHIRGDAVLRALAGRFQSILCPDDLACRLGRD